MNPNPLTSEPPPEFEPDEDVVLEFDEEGRRAMADWNWMNQQLMRRRLSEFGGHYIGVYNLAVVGHDKSLRKLREDVERNLGIPPTRLVTTFVPDSKGRGAGRMWLA